MVNIPNNCKTFCKVCQHGVYDMEKHILTKGHLRQVRRKKGEGYDSEPRLPGMPRGMNNQSPFPGRLRMGRQRK